MSELTSVSVVTPSYNQAEYIRDTLASVRNQSYSRVEHVVVDGDSDDGTTEILEAQDASVRWVSEPDEGQSDAINKGFDMAGGDIVGWLNSDDVYFDTNVLDRVVSYFEQFNADVIYGDIALIDADSRVRKVHLVPDFDYAKLQRYCFIEQPALFFDADVLADQRLDTSLEYVMDYEFWLRLAKKYEFRHVADVLAGDRNHPERKILNSRSKMQSEGRVMAQEHGASEPDRLNHRIGRATDTVRSGIPRRIAAFYRTLKLHQSQPTLAFEGEWCSFAHMARNLVRPNKDIL